MVYNCIDTIRNALFPPICPCCGGEGDRQLLFCPGCYAKLPFNDHACRHCALPLPPAAPKGSACGRCTRKRPPFHRTLAPLRYEAPVNHLISHLKFNRRLQLLEPLSNLLSSHLQGDGDLPDLVIPVPLHPLRLRERGFNQSLEIARLVAGKLQLETDWRSAKRIRPTPPQTDLSEKERQRNLRGAFSISGDLRGRHVALLDDVITTGATLTELSRLLIQHGVDRIDLWALARTPMHSG